MRGILTRLLDGSRSAAEVATARWLDRVAPVDETAPPSELDLRDSWSRCQTGCSRRWDTDRNGWRTCEDCTEVTGNRVL